MPENNPTASAGGRPPFEPTTAQRQMVEAMAGCGIPETDIAAVVGIAAKTLRKHFRAELATGHIKANAKVAGNLYRIATGNGREAVTAAIFWLKVRAQWKETSVHQHTGADGGPIEHIDVSALSDDDLDRLEDIINRAIGDSPARDADSGASRPPIP